MVPKRPRLLACIQATLVAGLTLLGLATASENRWDLPALTVIVLITVGSELLATLIGDGSAWLSGAFLAIVLAAVLYGSGPGIVIAVISICVGWLRSREAGWKLRNNVLNVALVALITAVTFHRLAATLGADARDAGYYLLVFIAGAVALLVNLLFVSVAVNAAQGPVAIARAVVAMVKPVFAAELASGLLTVAAVWVTLHLHLAGLIMFGLVLAVFQYLVGELLTSQQRGARLQRMATTDELTGLGNRESFRGAVEARIAYAERTGEGFSVLLMDLDRFKEINDTLGHVYGDRLLCELGPRLEGAVGEDGVVARLGGDEFGIMLAAADGAPTALEAIVERLLTAVGEPFSVDELSLEVGASLGVARYPDDGGDSHTLMRHADIAMYAAKEAQADYMYYTAEQGQDASRRLSVLSDIRRALADGELVVHYQPIVEVGSGRVTGAEGLVRWQHPERGLIPPGAFVQTVEQSGLIGPLTRHVLRSALAELARWRREGRDMSVAVNLSVRNLVDRDLPQEIERMLVEYGVPAQALQLEITESMIMSDPDRALATVGRLSRLGIRLSVDDFGTGYSSLANLRRLPIDELKIDRSFVSPMLTDESDDIIVRSTINLGHDLGLRVIAEGVEDSPTLARLDELGCDLAQGYHLSRPMDAVAFRRWLTDTHPRVSRATAPLTTA